MKINYVGGSSELDVNMYVYEDGDIKDEVCIKFMIENNKFVIDEKLIEELFEKYFGLNEDSEIEVDMIGGEIYIGLSEVEFMSNMKYV